MVCHFCAFNIPREGDVKNFVQISTILVLFNIIEIWKKFLISPVVTHKRQTTLWKCQDWENFHAIVSRIIYVKVGLRLNVRNEFKVLRWLSSRLATVMFRGTPCIFYYFKNSNSNNTNIFLVARNHQYRGFIINLRPNMFSFSNKIIKNSTFHATGRDDIFRVSSSGMENISRAIFFVPPRIVFASFRKIELFCRTVCYPLKPWE